MSKGKVHRFAVACMPLGWPKSKQPHLGGPHNGVFPVANGGVRKAKKLFAAELGVVGAVFRGGFYLSN